MKLFLLIIFLCGITSSPVHTISAAKAKKPCVAHENATSAKATVATIDIVPCGLLLQF